MTQAQRQQYNQLHQRRLAKYEKLYSRRLFVILHGQAKHIAQVVDEHGTQAAINALHRHYVGDGLAAAITSAHVQFGLYAARKATAEINASARRKVEKAGTLGRNEKWTADIINYFKNELFNTVQGIDQTTVDQLLGTITKGVNEGWSISKMVQELQTPELMLWRARLIARTELAKAGNKARELAAEDSEWMTSKEWISAHDNRVRDDHRAVDGEVIDSEARFNVGGEMMTGPGDPMASAKQICNCRCSLATFATRDDNGHLIPKPKSTIIVRPGNFTRPRQTVITI